MPPPPLLLLLLTAAADFSNVIREKKRKRVTYRGNRRSKLLSGERALLAIVLERRTGHVLHVHRLREWHLE